MNQEVRTVLAFSHCYGIGPMTFSELIKEFGSAEEAYNAPARQLKNLLDQDVFDTFSQFRKEFDPKKKLEEFKRKSIIVVTRESKFYPPPLLEIPDPPICLYVKGDIEQYDFHKEKFFAIVGTRSATSYGLHVAYTFAQELTAAGLIIVSGLALGIDTKAHEGAISQKMRTIAFLGCGVDIIYPNRNKNLYGRIINEGGLIISEFPPGQTVIPGLFVARNRLISGLSQGVLVVEGAADSGALITARYAAIQGRDVFATPAPITSQVSKAPNLLLKEGAKVVMSVEDILEEYNVSKNAQILKNTLSLNEEEQKVFDLLEKEPCKIDDLVLLLKNDINSTLRLLSLMELRKIVQKNEQGFYEYVNS